MTVLSQFERLEASALWCPEAGAARRDVVVSLGDATLAIYAMDETPLSHWSLPAVERRNPGQSPALYAPGPDAGETLEIEDELMIDAIERVDHAIRRGRRGPGALRGAVILGIVALVTLLAFWLPGALVRYAIAVAPPAVRADAGGRLLAQMQDIAGPACDDEAARAARAKLSERLLGGRGKLVVLRDPDMGAIALPGGTMVVGSGLVERYRVPDALVRDVVAAREEARGEDPMVALLNEAGPVAAFNLMTRGQLPEGALRARAGHLLSERETGGAVPPGFDAALAAVPSPVLTDGEWRAMQDICVQ